MLNEIIDAIGYENILEEIKNSKDKKTCLNIRVPIDREIDIEKDVLYVKGDEEVEIKDLELLNWFQERAWFSEFIDANKSVSIPEYIKKVYSNNRNAIFFNNETILKAIKSDKREYVEYLQGMIFGFLKSTKGEEYGDRFIKALDFIGEHKEDKALGIRLFLDTTIEEYESCVREYLNESISNSSIFVNTNTKKPLLKMVGSMYEDGRVDFLPKDEAIKTMYLRKYLTKTKTKDIPTKIGKIKIKKASENSQLVIVGYENIPYKQIDNFEEKNLIIKNILRKNIEREYVITKTSELYGKVESILGKSKDINGNIKMFRIKWSKYYGSLNNDNIEIFKDNINSFFRDLYHINTRSLDSEKLIDTLELDMSFRDWLFNTNKTKEMIDMVDVIEEKIRNMKDGYEIETDEEFSFMLGQLANYLKRNSNAVNKDLKMMRSYLTSDKVDKIIDILFKDLTKQGNVLLSSRATTVMAKINEYQAKNNLIKVDKNYYRSGLLNYNNVLFTKNNKKEGNENE